MLFPMSASIYNNGKRLAYDVPIMSSNDLASMYIRRSLAFRGAEFSTCHFIPCYQESTCRISIAIYWAHSFCQGGIFQLWLFLFFVFLVVLGLVRSRLCFCGLPRRFGLILRLLLVARLRRAISSGHQGDKVRRYRVICSRTARTCSCGAVLAVETPIQNDERRGKSKWPQDPP